MCIRFPLIAAGLLFASVAVAEDWPTFRGPNRDGICKETGLLKEWPKGGPPKVWTARGLGFGYGTPIVADGKIFGLGTVGGKEVLWALKEADGSPLWSEVIDDPRAKTNQNNGPSGSPTFDAGKLYAVSSKGRLVCLDAKSGKLLWHKSYTEFVNSAPSWGFTDTPLIDGDNLICVPTGSQAAVLAVKKATGEDVWKTPVPGGVGGGAGYSSVVKATIAGTPMYLILTGNKAGLLGINPANGKILWQYNGKPATGGVAQVPMPVAHKNHVWVSSSYTGGSALLEIQGEKDTFTVKELKKYTKPELNNHHGGMVQVGEYVYFGHDQKQGNPACVDLNTGELKWGPVAPPADPDPKKAGSAAVLFADGRLYFRYENHTLVLIEPSPDALKVVSMFKLPEPSGKESWPHPVIANGKLYIRDQDKLHCFNVKADKN